MAVGCLVGGALVFGLVLWTAAASALRRAAVMADLEPRATTPPESPAPVEAPAAPEVSELGSAAALAQWMLVEADRRLELGDPTGAQIQAFGAHLQDVVDELEFHGEPDHNEELGEILLNTLDYAQQDVDRRAYPVDVLVEELDASLGELPLELPLEGLAQKAIDAFVALAPPTLGSGAAG